MRFNVESLGRHSAGQISVDKKTWKIAWDIWKLTCIFTPSWEVKSLGSRQSHFVVLFAEFVVKRGMYLCVCDLRDEGERETIILYFWNVSHQAVSLSWTFDERNSFCVVENDDDHLAFFMWYFNGISLKFTGRQQMYDEFRCVWESIHSPWFKLFMQPKRRS